VPRFFLICLLFCIFEVGAQTSVGRDSVGASSSSAMVVAPAPVATPASRADSLEAAMKMQALGKVLANQGTVSTADVPRYQPPSIGKLLIRMVLGLSLVLGLIYLLYRMARRARGMDVREGELPLRSMQILETSYVGPNQKIVLVRVGVGRVLVVGSTPSQVHTLADLQGDEAKLILEQQRFSPAVSPAQFSETVNHLLRRFRKDGAS